MPANHQELKDRLNSSKDALIVLIGGSSGVGKTTVASEVARRLGITRHISTDIVREIIRALQPDNPAIQGSTFAQGSGEEVVAGFLKQAEVVGLGLRAVLKRARKEGINMVVDGANVVPSQLGEFLEAEDCQVIPVILSLGDWEIHSSRFRTRSLHSKRPAERYISRLEHIRAIQDFLVKDANRLGVPVVENLELEETVERVLALVGERFCDE